MEIKGVRKKIEVGKEEKELNGDVIENNKVKGSKDKEVKGNWGQYRFSDQEMHWGGSG